MNLSGSFLYWFNAGKLTDPTTDSEERAEEVTHWMRKLRKY